MFLGSSLLVKYVDKYNFRSSTGGEMAKRKAKGSIIYEILIILLVIILVATLLYPKSVWNKLESESVVCQDQMHRLVEAEALYISFQGDFNYDSSISNVISFLRSSQQSPCLQSHGLTPAPLMRPPTDHESLSPTSVMIFSINSLSLIKKKK